MTGAASQRLVALGASNLTRLALTVLDAARAAAGGPVDAQMALGHGRSYGGRCSVLGRGLGGIDTCGLWDHLASAPRMPTSALLMDVGNDLLYGVAPEQIATWVERCLGRLRPHCDRLSVVGLPLASIARLSPRHFAIFRRIIAPQSRLDLAGARAGAEQLNARLRQLAAAHGAHYHDLPGAWYGLDPIHVRRRFAPMAAATWLGTPRGNAPRRLDSLARRLGFLFAAPAERTLFGKVRHRAQPTRRWADGTTISLW